jgi:hypothetical protein
MLLIVKYMLSAVDRMFVMEASFALIRTRELEKVEESRNVQNADCPSGNHPFKVSCSCAARSTFSASG